MKVYIGPYYHWFQPARWYKDWILWAYGFGYKCDYEKIDTVELEKLTDSIHDSWAYSTIMAVERWFDQAPRKISVKIHNYDVWGMDHTLALIALPMLKLLKEKKQGSPFVDDDDVPEELRSTAAPPVEEYDTDENHHKRWDWVMDEMIWAFEQILNEDADSQFHYDLDPTKPRLAPGISFDEAMRRGGWDKDGATAFYHRKRAALMLFGKYFEALWD